ncbi:MAG: hypothetical protein ACYDG2_09260 [Ruminiclostridium sp.]
MQIIRGGFFNCYTSANASILNNLGRNPYMLFINGWDFSYDQRVICSPDSIGRRMNPFSNNIYAAIQENCGISIKIYNKLYRAECIEHVINALKDGLIIGYWGYSRWCPWSQFYQHEENDIHFFIISGYDSDTQSFTCTDTSYNLEEMPLDSNHFIKGFIQLCIYNEMPEKCNSYIDLMLKKTVNRLFSNNTFEQMKIFEHDLRYDFDFDSEIGCYPSSSASPLLLNLKEISVGRKGFSYLLNTTAENFYNHEAFDAAQISKELQSFALDWDKVRLSLIKCMYLSKNHNPSEEIAKEVAKILQRELLLAQELKDIFS